MKEKHAINIGHVFEMIQVLILRISCKNIQTMFDSIRSFHRLLSYTQTTFRIKIYWKKTLFIFHSFLLCLFHSILTLFASLICLKIEKCHISKWIPNIQLSEYLKIDIFGYYVVEMYINWWTIFYIFYFYGWICNRWKMYKTKHFATRNTAQWTRKKKKYKKIERKEESVWENWLFK